MANLKLGLLGPLQVTIDNAPITTFESDKVRALLAYLAVESEQPHRREALIGLLWPDSPEQTARRNLRQALYNLRQAIGDSTAKPPHLIITREEIQFNTLSDYSLDISRFNELLDRCEKHLPRCTEACPIHAANLQEAVKFYGGNFLQEFFLDDNVEFEEWALKVRERQRLRAQESLTYLGNYYERLGEYELAQRFVLRQLELDSWREEAHRQLMRVLVLNGQRSEALAQYEKCRRVLAEELGIEPSAETRELYLQIRDHGGIKKPEGDAKFRQTASRQPAAMPVHLTPFVGREHELAELARLLTDDKCRLVSLVGAGGIGKTRLALEAAHTLQGKFADGVVFVPLAPLNSSTFISSAIGEAVGLVFSGLTEPKLQLLSTLCGKQMLLILDNLEHLLADGSFEENGAGLFDELLQHAPQVKLLITSREPLNLRHEWVFQLGGLDLPLDELAHTITNSSAVTLFAQSARRAQAGFGMQEQERRAVARICQVVGGNPLAIELAASWVRMLSCDEIVQEIERNLDFLAASQRNMPERHRSMRAVFDHSWQMLNGVEQEALAKLSVFSGGFNRDAAAQVAQASLSVLASLISKFLVVRLDSDRYGFHELIRLYARERLTERGELDGVRDAHLNYFIELAEAAEPKLYDSEQIIWLDRLEREHDNLRTALEWAMNTRAAIMASAGEMRIEQTQSALRLVGALFLFWGRRDHWSEGRQWLSRALAQSNDPAPSLLRAKALRAAVILAVEQADVEVAHKLSEQNLAVARELGDPHALAAALSAHGYLLWKQKEFAPARAYCEQGLGLSRTLEDREATAESLHYLAHIATNQNDLPAARIYLQESAAIFRTIGDAFGWNFSLNDLGLIAYLQNDYLNAISLFEASLEGFRQIRSTPGIVSALNGLGDLARATGNYERAGTLYEECVRVYRDMGDQDEFPSILHNLAYVAEHRGEHARALDLFRDALMRERDIHNRAGVAECLVGIAVVLVAQGDPQLAARLFAAAEALRESVGASLWPADRAEHERGLIELGRLLDSESVAACWREGQSMTLEDAISKSLGD